MPSQPPPVQIAATLFEKLMIKRSVSNRTSSSRTKVPYASANRTLCKDLFTALAASVSAQFQYAMFVRGLHLFCEVPSTLDSAHFGICG